MSIECLNDVSRLRIVLPRLLYLVSIFRELLLERTDFRRRPFCRTPVHSNGLLLIRAQFADEKAIEDAELLRGIINLFYLGNTFYNFSDACSDGFEKMRCYRTDLTVEPLPVKVTAGVKFSSRCDVCVRNNVPRLHVEPSCQMKLAQIFSSIICAVHILPTTWVHFINKVRLVVVILKVLCM